MHDAEFMCVVLVYSHHAKHVTNDRCPSSAKAGMLIYRSQDRQSSRVMQIRCQAHLP